MKEEWRDINGYEDKYQVSNLGNVKSLSKIAQTKGKYGQSMERQYSERILKYSINPKGYKIVRLSNNKIQKNRSIHRLVAEMFIPNTENKSQINHIDGNKENNYVNNLEWVTNKENINHAINNGLINIEKVKKRLYSYAIKKGVKKDR